MSERDVALYIEDMLEFSSRAIEYATGLTEATLTAERMRYDAILRNIELVGEAATHVPDDVRARATDVPWRQIVGARNRIAHGYLGIASETIWDILERQLPALRLSLQHLLQALQRPQA